MAAAGSMRDTLAALTSTFTAPAVPHPLPTELQHTIEAFLERHQQIEEHDSQRFHEDLLALYLRHVAGHAEKHGPFLSVLRKVRPALSGEARMNEWWGLVVKPTITTIGHTRNELEDARGFVQELMAFDADDDKTGERARLSKHFSTLILDAYLSRTKLPGGEDHVVSPEDEFVSQELESILVAFGRQKPKELLIALDNLFVQKQYRIQALNLLSAFVRLQPPHLYLVLETSLIQHLEKCLLIDTSSTAIELALMVLIMFLPHITAALTSDHHLAKLFLIYSRILCWDKIGASGEASNTDEESDEPDHGDSQPDTEGDPRWESLEHSLDYPDTSPPTVLHYFTFLYGLFPLNFTSFLRKSRKYLKSQNFPGAEDFELDQDLIHSRTEPYRRVHLLHPNLFTTTLEDELTENRLLKSDPADVVTECMDLCVAVSTTLSDPGPPPTSKLPALPAPPVTELPQPDAPDDDEGNVHDSSVSWRNTQSTVFAASTVGQLDTFDIPPKPKSLKSSASASPLLKCRDIMDSPTLPPVKEDQKLDSLGFSLVSPQNPEPPVHRLGNFVQALSTRPNSPTQSDFQNQSMAALQREIMLLRNDLNFERYLKQQHLTHIGQLQRRHIREATDAAEQHNLINANRTLKARLAKANELYAQLKKETNTSRSQSKKWEVELSSKVKSYREEQKSWHSGEQDLQAELKKSQQDCEHLKRMVEKAEAEQLRAEQRTRALEFELEDYGNVRRELETVQEKVLVLEDQSKGLQSLVAERDELRNQLEVANMRLNSREFDRERSFQAYERRIIELEARLQTAERNPGKTSQLPSSMQQMLDSALAANKAKMQQMKKVHHRLLEQYTELELKYHDLLGETQAEQGRYPQEKYTYKSPEKDSLSRSFSVRQNISRDSNYVPSGGKNDYDYYGDYNSPISVNAHPPTSSPTRPIRHEPTTVKRPGTANVGFGQDFSAAYDATLNAHFQSTNAVENLASSGKSTYSEDSNKGEKKDKVAPKSDVRIYGRGGAQNIGKKAKDKEKEKEQKKLAQKTGGFRGLKGIM